MESTDTPETDAPKQNPPLTWFGKSLVLVSIAFTFIFGYYFTSWLIDRLDWPLYPMIIFIVLTVAVGFGFWVLLSSTCEKLGLPVFRKSPPADAP